MDKQSMKRRTLLGGAATLMGAALADAAETPKAGTGGTVAVAAPANLNPPVVQVKEGKLRGFKDGKTYAFYGVPYATAERFELPKPVAAWEGIKSAQAYGPVCPIPAMSAPGADEFVFPHRYWMENEHCQVLNIW